MSECKKGAPSSLPPLNSFPDLENSPLSPVGYINSQLTQCVRLEVVHIHLFSFDGPVFDIQLHPNSRCSWDDALTSTNAVSLQAIWEGDISDVEVAVALERRDTEERRAQTFANDV